MRFQTWAKKLLVADGNLAPLAVSSSTCNLFYEESEKRSMEVY